MMLSPRPVIAALVPLLALFALPAAVSAAPAPAKKATAAPARKVPAAHAAVPAARDWTKAVSLSPSGGFILGNPNAKTKLVEYMSYSCPHCAEFAKVATAELKSGWIKRGALSIEYRNFVRDPFDVAASLIARCGGQARFLANHELIFSSYDDWIEKAETYAKADHGQMERTAQLTDIADKLGFLTLAGTNGVPADAARKCIADPGALGTIMTLRSDALKTYPEFEGTPTFVLDGKELKGIHSWEGLKPLLPPLPAPGK